MADLIFPGQSPSLTLGSTRLPQNVDLEIWQGDAQTYVINLTDSNGAAYDLTGITPAAEMRQDFLSPTLYAFTCTVPAAGQVELYMSSSVCATIPAGSYVWSLQLADSNGDVRTYLAGDVTVFAEVPIVN